MKKITPKMKRIGMLIAVVAVGGAAVTLLMGQAHAGAIKDAEDPSSASTSSAELVLATPEPITPESSSSDTGSAFVPSSGATASKTLTVTSKPSSMPSKPMPPASSALTDKSKKPSYPTTPKAPAPKRNTGTNNGGSTYSGNNDPIFGNKQGTGGKAINSPDAGGDINKQIGSMD